MCVGVGDLGVIFFQGSEAKDQSHTIELLIRSYYFLLCCGSGIFIPDPIFFHRLKKIVLCSMLAIDRVDQLCEAKSCRFRSKRWPMSICKFNFKY
jgi:hypothetical protein